MVDDVPDRMVFAGKRWRVTDTPTRLRDAVWGAALDGRRSLYGWRYQATSEAGEVVMFDVFRDKTEWHVHHTYT
ncbi:MAG: hypothetical protein ACTHNQ_19380 [Microbacterium sp.]|uniref:hypothetical protein n=1 Tax=Microbacterium sp. TaxID=51671 RepID=UPI003F80D67A